MLLATNSTSSEVKINTSKPKAIYRSTKTYGHNEGLSCSFRQWKAQHSHCKLIHGYALGVKLIFATYELNDKNWCFDFGALKDIRAWLHSNFDHTLVVAKDDPFLQTFIALEEQKLVDIRIVTAVGCEAFAEFIYDYVSKYVNDQSAGRVWLESVELSEHSGNSAIFEMA